MSNGCSSAAVPVSIWPRPRAASWSILTGEKSRAIPASEITLFPQLFSASCQPVLITRSGYTSEALQAAEYLETKLQLRTLAITCGTGTPIEKIASHCIKLTAADEKSTVMTRSFTSMLITLQSLAAIRGNRGEFLDGAAQTPRSGRRTLERHSRHDQVAGGIAHLCGLCVSRAGPFFRHCAGIYAESERNVLLLRAVLSHAGVPARPESDRQPGNADHFHHQRNGICGGSRGARRNQKTWRHDARHLQRLRFHDSPRRPITLSNCRSMCRKQRAQPPA